MSKFGICLTKKVRTNIKRWEKERGRIVPSRRKEVLYTSASLLYTRIFSISKMREF